MSLKTILCAYSGDAERGYGLRHAIRLAKRHNAHLTGVAKTGGLGFMHRQLPAQIPQSVRDQLDENGRQILSNTVAQFEALTAESGLGETARFVELDPKREGPVGAFARAFDLVVIGYHTASIYEDDLGAHPDLIALRSGRPVLIVPEGHDDPSPATSVTVAWDGKRASTRALNAAMPLYADADEVTLVSVGQEPRNTNEMLRTMRLHGVNAQAETVAQGGRIADALLDCAKRRRAGLLVMGAFEHSKFSHDVIGGATTDVLEHTDVPVLMAH